MHLNRIDKRALRIINDAYPFPYDPKADRDKAVEERPYLLTTEEIHVKCTATLNDVRNAITRLCQFQLVESVYLFGPGEFCDQQMTGGRTIRHFPLPMSCDQPSTGRDAFQITQRGQEKINSFLPERFKRAALKFVEEKGAVTLTGAISLLGGWLLGHLGLMH